MYFINVLHIISIERDFICSRVFFLNCFLTLHLYFNRASQHSFLLSLWKLTTVCYLYRIYVLNLIRNSFMSFMRGNYRKQFFWNGNADNDDPENKCILAWNRNDIEILLFHMNFYLSNECSCATLHRVQNLHYTTGVQNWSPTEPEQRYACLGKIDWKINSIQIY